MSFDDAKNRLLADLEHSKSVSASRILEICGDDDRLAELLREFVVFHDVATEFADGGLQRCAVQPTDTTREEVVASDSEPKPGTRFFVKVFGKEWGPVDFEGLKRMVTTGELCESDSIRSADGDDGWFLASRMSALFEVQSAEVQSAEVQSAEVQSANFDLELRDEIAEEMHAQIEEDLEVSLHTSSHNLSRDESNKSTTETSNSGEAKSPTDGGVRLGEDSADAPIEPVQPQTSSHQPSRRPPPPPPVAEASEPKALESDLHEVAQTATSAAEVSHAEASGDDSVASAESPVADSDPATPPTDTEQLADAKPAGNLQPTHDSKPLLKTKPSSLHFASLYVWSHLRYNPLIHVALVFALIVGGVWNVFISPPEKAALEVYGEIWGQLKNMRDNGASATKWEKFTEAATGEIDAVVVRLEDSAAADEPARQELLWAGDLFLRRMLSDARLEPSRSENLFVQHFEKAKSIMSGNEPEYGNDELPAANNNSANNNSTNHPPEAANLDRNPSLDDSRLAN